MKAELFCELMNLSSAFSAHEHEHVSFFISPSEVRCSKRAGQGAIKLAPSTEMAKIVQTSASKKHAVTGGAQLFYLEPPKRIASTDNSLWRKDQLLSAYWLVNETAVPEDANMKLTSVKQGKYMFPVYVNFRAVNVHEKLLVLKATGAPVAKAAPVAAKKRRT